MQNDNKQTERFYCISNADNGDDDDDDDDDYDEGIGVAV